MENKIFITKTIYIIASEVSSLASDIGIEEKVVVEDGK